MEIVDTGTATSPMPPIARKARAAPRPCWTAATSASAMAAKRAPAEHGPDIEIKHPNEQPRRAPEEAGERYEGGAAVAGAGGGAGRVKLYLTENGD